MSKLALPTFRYHPDPVATGAFEPTDGPCTHCGAATGYVYAGPVYAEDEPEPPCPACIADGSFAATFEAEFTDAAALAGLSEARIDEVTRRTPGFAGWQQEQWLTHCEDAAAFLGAVGHEELAKHPLALADLRARLADADDMASDDIDEHVAALSRDESPTAYLFRCLHCGAELAYSDAD